MKNYIIAFEKSDVREKAVLKADFDTIQQAEDYMLDHLTFEEWCVVGEIVVLKRQDHNQWWNWDFKTGQGWQPFEVQSVLLAREKYIRQLEEVQTLINAAAKLEYDHPDEPTHDVAWALRHARIKAMCATAQMRTEQAKVNLLKAVLEAHGNIEWPIIE